MHTNFITYKFPIGIEQNYMTVFYTVAYYDMVDSEIKLFAVITLL